MLVHLRPEALDAYQCRVTRTSQAALKHMPWCREHPESAPDTADRRPGLLDCPAV